MEIKQFTFKEKLRILLSFPVIIAALGYFVDIYDLLLFGIVRIPSLESMGLDADKVGTMIINYQMIGLVLVLRCLMNPPKFHLQFSAC